MKERLYKNWYIIDGGLGYKLYPRDFYDDKILKKWYDNGFSCEFTTIKSAKEYISSKRSTCYYNEVIEYFEKVRNK